MVYGALAGAVHHGLLILVPGVRDPRSHAGQAKGTGLVVSTSPGQDALCDSCHFGSREPALQQGGQVLVACASVIAFKEDQGVA